MDRADARLLKAFGEAVRTGRKTLRMPQEALAEKAKLSRNYVSDIERGIRNPSLLAVIHIARALRTSVADLFDATD